MDGEPWEIAWGELRWEGARWKDGKPWEIAWGELGSDILRSRAVGTGLMPTHTLKQGWPHNHRMRLTWKIWDWTFPNMDLVQNIGVFHSKIAGLNHPSY